MSWGGVPLNTRTSLMMDEAQALYGGTITATQGSPSSGVSASAGTHNGEGVIDVTGADLDAIVIAMRMVGFAAWHRTPAQGFIHHVHGVAIGEPLLSEAAAQQVASYFDNRNGLANNGVDDGPRDWVGVTWETYTGAPPIDTGDRPEGTPFWGESLPVDDWDVTSGSPTYYDADGNPQTFPAPLAVQKHDTGSGNDSDAYTATTAGDDILWIVGDTGTYLSGTESPQFVWVIRARGTGTLVLADDVDPDWNYTPAPANPLGSVNVASGSFTDYEVVTTSPTASSIVDGDGTRLQVTVTSGAVDIVWVALAVRPVNGVLGDYGPEVFTDDAEVVADSGSRGTATGSDDHTENTSLPAVPWHDAWIEAVENLGDAVNRVTSSVLLSAQYQTLVELDGTGQWQFQLGYTAIDVGAGTRGPDPTGTEGIDFIRRPDRTEYDDDAYWKFDSGLPYVVTWLNNSVSFDTDNDDYPGGTDWILRQTSYKAVPFSGTVSVPDLRLGPTLASAPAGINTQTGLAPVGTDGRFGLSFYSSLIDSDPGLTPPTPLVAYAGQYRVYLGEADFAEDPSTWLPLTAKIAIPTARFYKPGLYGDRPDDPDGGSGITWLRQKQRNDGLGNSVIRAKRGSSRQTSLRQRGYR